MWEQYVLFLLQSNKDFSLLHANPVGLEDSGFGHTEEGHLTLCMRASRGSDVSVRQYVGVSQMKGEESYPGEESCPGEESYPGGDSYPGTAWVNPRSDREVAEFSEELIERAEWQEAGLESHRVSSVPW